MWPPRPLAYLLNGRMLKYHNFHEILNIIKNFDRNSESRSIIESNYQSCLINGTISRIGIILKNWGKMFAFEKWEFWKIRSIQKNGVPLCYFYQAKLIKTSVAITKSLYQNETKLDCACYSSHPSLSLNPRHSLRCWILHLRIEYQYLVWAGSPQQPLWIGVQTCHLVDYFSSMSLSLLRPGLGSSHRKNRIRRSILWRMDWLVIYSM